MAVQQIMLAQGSSGGPAPGAEYTSATFSQRSIYAQVATNANMRDANPNAGVYTGGGTDYSSGGNQWIRADLGGSVPVSKITLGGGSLPSFGPTAAYCNGCELQHSSDGSLWTTLLTVSGVTDTGDKDFTFTTVNARYWRIIQNNYVATCTFRFFA